MGYAVPACSLAQMRRLEQVASTRRTVISASERLRRMWIEGAMCLLFPPLMLPLLYVVQGHRYDIIEGIGCHVTAVISWPGIAIKLLFPIVISIATLIYSGEFPSQLSGIASLTWASLSNSLVLGPATAIQSDSGLFPNGSHDQPVPSTHCPRCHRCRHSPHKRYNRSRGNPPDSGAAIWQLE